MNFYVENSTSLMASFVAACMGHRLRQNDTNISEIYIGHPIYISNVRYLYPTSDIYFQHRDIPALALALALAVALALALALAVALALALAQLLSEVRYCISDVTYRYRTSDVGTRVADIGTQMSDIYIGRRI